LLPGAHGDPFDRMMAAQALIENLTVVTRDPAFAGFGCGVRW
jgi:PIN domain nuclease of toxin-antitoxin system